MKTLPCEHYKPAKRYFSALIRSVCMMLIPALAMGPHLAQAQGWPDRAVRLVVPYAAGGPTDILARIIAEGMRESLGIPIVVDNRPGASGAIAYQGVAKSPADGYTLTLIDIPFLTNAVLTPGTPYDSQRDFSPIGMIGYAPVVLVVSRSSGISSLNDLLARAKAPGSKLSYGSAGNGSPPHLSMETFARHAGIKMTHVPYKGASAALVDISGGHVDTMFVGVSAARPLIASDSVRPLAVTSAKRMSSLPLVPTLKELGFSDENLNFGPWWGIAGPANLPPNIVAKSNAAIRSAISRPATQKSFEDQAIVSTAGSPEELATFLKQDDQHWRRAIKSVQINNQ